MISLDHDNDIIRPLCIRLSQMTGHARKFDENATISFIVKDKQLLKEIYWNMGKNWRVNEDKFWK